MQRRIVGTSLATALLFAVSFTGTASASSIKALRLEVGGTAMSAGAPIVATSTDTTIANAFWSLACTEGELTGTVGQNNKAKDDFIPITEGRFLGGGTEGLCESGFNFVTAFLPEQPSELILERKGGAQWRFPRFRMTPLEDVNNPPGHKEACVAASNAVKGTFPLTTTPQPLTVTFSNAKMHLEADHGHECSGKKGHNPYMSATYTFTSRGQPVEAEIFEHE
jgi:hypothetical protein